MNTILFLNKTKETLVNDRKFLIWILLDSLISDKKQSVKRKLLFTKVTLMSIYNTA